MSTYEELINKNEIIKILRQEIKQLEAERFEQEKENKLLSDQLETYMKELLEEKDKRAKALKYIEDKSILNCKGLELYLVDEQIEELLQTLS